MKTLKLLFMGTPAFALPSLERLRQSGHRLDAVVTRPDRPRGRGGRLCFAPVKEWALRHQVAVYQPFRLKEEGFLCRLRELAPDLIVTAAYGKILPPEILALPPQGCINLHASLLPAYRGAAPIERAVMDGALLTGVTVIMMAPEMDAGDIILQEAEPVGATDTAGELHDRLAVKGAALLVRAVEELARGVARPVPQDPAGVSYAPPLRPEEERLDWRRPALFLYNQIRGMHPRPGAYTTFEGRRLKVWRAAPPALATGQSPKPGSEPLHGSLPEPGSPPKPSTGPLPEPVLSTEPVTGQSPEPGSLPPFTGQFPKPGAFSKSFAGPLPEPGSILGVTGEGLLVAAGDGALELLELQPEGKRSMAASSFYRGCRPPAGARFA